MTGPASPLPVHGCPLCEADGGTVVLAGSGWRVIRANEAGFPAFYRVVLTDHVAEWTDLDELRQAEVLRVVSVVERALRDQLQPTKINLAALGNVVPHLHWHVIARFDWDSHFPAPVWAVPLRQVPEERLQGVQSRLSCVEDQIRQRMAALA